MAGTPPTLRQHSTGVWFVRWGGRDHYFSLDRSASERAYTDPGSDHHGSLLRWAEWRAATLAARAVRGGRGAGGAGGARPSVYLIDIEEQFLAEYEAEGRRDTALYFRKHLSRFMGTLGRLRADEVSLGVLRAWRTDLMTRLNTGEGGLSARTIAHDIGAVKTMLKWAAENELAPPLALSAIKKPKAPPPAFERLTRERVLGIIARAEMTDAGLAAHLALTYLCVMRPSETLRVIAGRGRFDPVTMPDGSVHARGVFVLPEHKTTRRVSFPRHVIFSDEALRWFDSVRPRWSRLDGFSARSVSIVGCGPKLLQKAACWHLQLAGVAEEDIDLIQGHAGPGVRRHYRRAELGRQRVSASLLTLQSSG